MRRWFMLVITLLLLVVPQPVRAQNTVSFQSLEVNLWPEYDQEGKVLVLYRITLAATVKLPTEITLRIPAQAAQPHAVAELSGDTLNNVAGGFQMLGREGNYELVRFTATLPQIQFEYYDPQLSLDGAQRSFTYRWPGDYAVEQMSISIQQPPSATALKVEPAMGSLGTGEDGLNYFSVPVGQVTAATSFDLEITYNKDNKDLTNPRTFQQVTPAGPVSTDTPGRVTLQELLPWLLGVLGLGLIGGGIFWYTRAGHAPAISTRTRHRASAESESPSKNTSSASAVFCHQCGKPASTSDVFCRICGTKLKH